MTSELTILGYFGLLVGLTTFLQLLLAMPQLGLPYLLGTRDEGLALTGIAARCGRCLGNSITALALFAPAALALHITGGSSGATVFAAQIFLIGRILYVPAYLFAVPYLRTLSWVAAFGATLFLYLMVI